MRCYRTLCTERILQALLLLSLILSCTGASQGKAAHIIENSSVNENINSQILHNSLEELEWENARVKELQQRNGTLYESRRRLDIGDSFGAEVPTIRIQCDETGNVFYSANTLIQKVIITLDGDGVDETFTTSTLRKIKIIRSTEDCTSEFPAAVNEASRAWMQSGVGLAKVGLNHHIIEAVNGVDGLTFIMGGMYSFCYSNVGDFATGPFEKIKFKLELGNNDVSEETETFLIRGVYNYGSTLAAPLSATQYNCYISKKAYNTLDRSFSKSTSCVVNYDDNAGMIGFEGSPTSASWTPISLETQVSECGVENVIPASFICNDGDDCADGDQILFPTNAESTQISVPCTRDTLDDQIFIPYRVNVCYCPLEQVSCQSTNYLATNFRQQIGILNFYLIKLCDYITDTCSFGGGSTDYTGGTPELKFVVRVECPWGACTDDNNSRIRIIEKTDNNEFPQWNDDSACGTANHGVLDGDYILSSPENCENDLNPLDCQLSGGTDKYKKIFGKTEGGFLFNAGSTEYEAKNFHTPKYLDVCYCHSANCATQKNDWFKVGQIRFASFRFIARANEISETRGEFALEFVGQEGVMGFHRSLHDADTLGLQQEGTLRMLLDNDNTRVAADCLDVRNNAITNINESSIKGKFDNANPIMAKRLVFNSGEVNNYIKIAEAGIYSICYCQFEDQCREDYGWKMVSRKTIRGPLATFRRWEYSTNVVFRLDYEGWGLSGENRLRITTDNDKCDNESGQPTKAASANTFIKVECPWPCNSVGEVNEVVNGDLKTQVLSSETWGCTKMFEDCVTNYIIKIEVVSDTLTEISFDLPPDFENGKDRIILGDNIFADTNASEEQLSVLKGLYDYADGQGGDPNVPVNYQISHAVTMKTEDPLDPEWKKKITIPIGWPEKNGKRPEFKVVQNSKSQKGRWVRPNKAVTREEIMGTKEKANLKVCWHYGDAIGKFVAEVGKLTLKDPHQMSEARISLTTTVRGQKAPIVISFQTASGESGKPYSKISTSKTQLKLMFTKLTSLDIYQSDLTTSDIDDNEQESKYETASQHVCGKLFIELWSDDTQNGFPMPKGCYHKKYGETRELYLVFEERNGLKAGHNYQLVMNAAATNAIAGESYVEIFTMDDMDSDHPYIVIERGIAHLNKSPEDAAYGSDGHKFLDPGGFKIVGGINNIKRLGGNHPLRVEIMGDPFDKAGGIAPSCIIRIFLWPLTQWKTGSSCDAKCVTNADGESILQCGEVPDCKGEPVVSNFNNNVLKFTLPSTMDTIYGPRKQVFDIGGITWPSGGVFLGRLAAQVTTPKIIGAVRESGDDKPFYVISAGDFIHKDPDDGRTIGKLVHIEGDGNLSPFREDKDNVLYAKIIVSSTLFSAMADHAAYFKITPPDGYTCKVGTPVTGQTSTWAVPPDLQLFGDIVPQGRGTLTDGWSIVDNGRACKYSFLQYGVVYAGTSLMIRLTVDNPNVAIQQAAADNRWTIEMGSRGYYAQKLITPEQAFKSLDGDYSGNVAVLGKLSDFYIQPQSFIAGENKLWVFFTTEQNNGPNGYVLVEGPDGFQPDTPCDFKTDIGDLEKDSFYAVGRGKSTNRLPKVQSCSFHDKGKRFYFRLTGSLLANTSYAFWMKVDNPTAYVDTQRDAWRIYTLDTELRYIDGTKETVPFSNGEARSWGMYQDSLFITQVIKNDDLRPYEMSGTYAEYTITIPTKTVDFTSDLRITIPDGYEWYLNNYVHDVAKFPKAPNALDPTTPNILTFDAMNFLKSTQYKLELDVKVPVEGTREMANDYTFFEFGYQGTILTDRKYGKAVGGDPDYAIQSIVGALVDYTTSVQGKENIATLELRTATYVSGGYIKIKFPSKFTVAQDDGINCKVMEPKVMVGNNFSSLQSAQCTFSDSTNELQLKGSFNPDIYRFSIKASNPPDPVPLLAKPPGSNCGTLGLSCCWTSCWDFKTTNSGGADLDFSISIPGFDINKKMVEARLPDLTESEMLGTQRNNRPLAENNLVFSFQLFSDAILPGLLKIRGPEGFIFAEDCLSTLETRESSVFGPGNKFPPIYEVWPDDAKVISCSGVASEASILIEPQGQDAGLKAEKRYVIRIGIAQNPVETPKMNKWSMEYNYESADPFDGFELWTFSDVDIYPVTTNKNLNKEQRIINPVTINFKPWNKVHIDEPFENAGSLIRITAPTSFEFVAENNECYAGMIEKEEIGMIDHQNWTDQDLTCRRPDNNKKNIVELKLSSSKYIYAGRQYSLILEVYNPTEVGSGNIGIWQMETFNTDDGNPVYALDEKKIQGFAVSSMTKSWKVMNEDNIRNGETEIDELNFELKFDIDWKMNEIVEITAPRFNYKYEFINCFGTQDGWSIAKTTVFGKNGPTLCSEECDKINAKYFGLAGNTCFCGDDFASASILEDGCITPCEDELGDMCGSTKEIPAWSVYKLDFIGFSLEGNPNGCNPKDFRIKDAGIWGPRVCLTFAANVFTMKATSTIEEAIVMKFALKTRNPSKTLLKSRNYWTVKRFDTSGKIVDSNSVSGWSIVPQLSDLKIQLVGADKSASSISEIKIKFTPVSNADLIRIEATQPLNFDFTNAEILTSGQEILDAAAAEILLRVKIRTGKTEVLHLGQIRLGHKGGPCKFNISTLNGSETMDERLDFVAFRLPGRIDIIKRRLRNVFEDDPDQYPVKSMFGAQMESKATATFHITLSYPVQVGNVLIIKAPGYSLAVKNFEINLFDAGPIELEPFANDSIVRTKDWLAFLIKTEMKSTPPPYEIGLTHEYLVDVKVNSTPAYFNSLDTWTFETWNEQDFVLHKNLPPEDSLDVLPTCTNDASTPTFNLVKEIDVEISAGKSPPLASIDVKVMVDPRGSKPNELIIWAPPNFNFTEECLVQPTPLDVRVCTVSFKPVKGRVKAVLQLREEGIEDVLDNLYIRVLTPMVTPTDFNWHVEATNSFTKDQVGWGEAKGGGFPVIQMRDTGVLFPGVPGKAQTTFKFRTVETVENEGTLQIYAPDTYELECEGFHTISLPGNTKCMFPDGSTGPSDSESITSEESIESIDEEGGVRRRLQLPDDIETEEPNNNGLCGHNDRVGANKMVINLRLNETVVPGMYSFSLIGNVPTATPLENTFSLLLLDKDCNVVDASMNVPGRDIQPGIKMSAYPLQWSRSEVAKYSAITVGFNIFSGTQKGKEVRQRIGEILINFPQGFVHAIEVLAHVEVERREEGNPESIKPGMALTSDYLDFTQKDRIRISLKSPPGLEKEGLYLFTFPVVIPVQMPAYNVWILSICEAQGGCISSMDSSVKVAFPLAGFEIGQPPPGGLMEDNRAHARPRSVPNFPLHAALSAFVIETATS